ncbi:hypothetical protein HDU76_012360 [Blyttiomyces sp. JEL0837]|nr:hypothetical protein HDU76_012360 [Blyttiomyces sp. JEL0837]
MQLTVTAVALALACMMSTINATPAVPAAPPSPPKISAQAKAEFTFHKNEAAPINDPSGLGACITTPNLNLLINKGQTQSPYDCLLRCAYAGQPYSAFAFPAGFSGTPTMNTKVACFCARIDAPTYISATSDSQCSTPCVPNGLFGCGQLSSDPNTNSTLNAVATDDIYYENFLIFIGAFLGA